MKKPLYMKAAEAIKVAEAANQPILLFFLVDRDPLSDFLRQKVMTNKLFRDELVKQNAVLLSIKIKPEMPKNPREKPKKIDLKGMKETEIKIIQNFGHSRLCRRRYLLIFCTCKVETRNCYGFCITNRIVTKSCTVINTWVIRIIDSAI